VYKRQVLEGAASILLLLASDLSWHVERKVYYTISGTANEGLGGYTSAIPTGDVDHYISDGYFVIDRAVTSQAVYLGPILDDLEYEVPFETVIVTLSGADFSTIDPDKNTFEFMIEDNDVVPPEVSMELSAFNVPEPTDAPVAIRVQLASAHNLDSKIQYTVSGTATAGTDHSLLPGWVSIPAGETEGTIFLRNVYDDAIYEVSGLGAHENIIVTLIRGRNAILKPGEEVCTITIVDNDADPALPFGQPPDPIIIPPSQVGTDSGLLLRDPTGKVIWDSTVIAWNYLEYFEVVSGATHNAPIPEAHRLKNIIVMRWMVNTPPDNQEAIVANVTKSGYNYIVSGGTVTTAGILLGR
jgi:hypothetical protein